MFRVIAILAIGVFLIFAGCNKDSGEVDKIGEEASVDEAQHVMDSLQGNGEAVVDSMAAVDAPPPPVKEEKPDISNRYDELSGYVVQVGSYAEYDFAKMMADKYTDRDYPAFVVSVDLDGIRYYRLRIGVYETLDEAKQVGELIKDRYSAEYWIDFN